MVSLNQLFLIQINSKVQRITDLALVKAKVFPVQLKHTKVFPMQLKHTATLGRDYQQVSLSDKVNPEKETARYFCKGTNRNFRAS